MDESLLHYNEQMRTQQEAFGWSQHAEQDEDDAAPSASAAGENCASSTGWAAKRESDYNAALKRYYDTGTEEDHEACLKAFGLWIIAVREEKPPIVPVSHSETATGTVTRGEET